jgi:Secretion system C-terminal sorting domain
MKKIISTIYLLLFSIGIININAQDLRRHYYAIISSPINNDFPFDNGIVDLNKLNPVYFLKDKISRDTQQNWDKKLQRWNNNYVVQNNFLPKCGNIISRYEYDFDSLNRAFLIFSDTFTFENNRLKSIQNYEYKNGIKQIYESTQFVFKSNTQAPDTVFAVQGTVKKRLSYKFSGNKPTLIKQDEIDSNQQFKPQLQCKLIYLNGFLDTFLVEKWIDNAWKLERITNYRYNDLGSLTNIRITTSYNDSQDTTSYTYKYNDNNYLIQLDYDILGRNATHLLTYKFSNFNAQGQSINVDIYANKPTPFIKVVYENLIDDGKIRNSIVQSRDENGNYVISSRTRTVFCGDNGDGNGNGTTKLEEMNNFNFTISPNPAQDFIRIEAQSLENSSFSASIYDELGRLVVQEYNRKINDVIPISNLTNGVYVLKLTGTKQVGVVKFIVQG